MHFLSDAHRLREAIIAERRAERATNAATTASSASAPIHAPDRPVAHAELRPDFFRGLGRSLVGRRGDGRATCRVIGKVS